MAGLLLTGSVVTETVFAWPGTGLLAVEAVQARDYQVVQAVVLSIAGIFIVSNLVVDIPLRLPGPPHPLQLNSQSSPT